MHNYLSILLLDTAFVFWEPNPVALACLHAFSILNLSQVMASLYTISTINVLWALSNAIFVVFYVFGSWWAFIATVSVWVNQFWTDRLLARIFSFIWNLIGWTLLAFSILSHIFIESTLWKDALLWISLILDKLWTTLNTLGCPIDSLTVSTLFVAAYSWVIWISYLVVWAEFTKWSFCNSFAIRALFGYATPLLFSWIALEIPWAIDARGIR